MSATFIDLFFIPLFYVMVCSLFQRKRLEPLSEPETELSGGGG
jgi:multidrug efflux pump